MEAGHQSAAESAGCHSVAGTEAVVDLGCDSTDKMVPGTSAESLVVGWNAGGCCFQRSVPEASSFWHPSPCAYCQSQ